MCDDINWKTDNHKSIGSCCWLVVSSCSNPLQGRIPGGDFQARTSKLGRWHVFGVWLNRTYPELCLLLPFVCLLHKGEPSVSRLTRLLIAVTSTHSQSDDLESRQPVIRRSAARLRSCTVQLYCACGLRHFFCKGQDTCTPLVLHPPEGSETQTTQNLCCYSYMYISAKHEGTTRAHPDS